MKLSQELIQEAKIAQSVEELREMAKAKGVELTCEQAELCWSQLHQPTGEMADDELDAVAGGGCSTVSMGRRYPVVTAPNKKCGHYVMGSNDFNYYVGATEDTCGACQYLRSRSGLHVCVREYWDDRTEQYLSVML